MPAHTKREVSRRLVARIPGWPAEWMESKMARRRETGTKGQKVPVEESPNSSIWPTRTEVTQRDGRRRNLATSGHESCKRAMAAKSTGCAVAMAGKKCVAEHENLCGASGKNRQDPAKKSGQSVGGVGREAARGLPSCAAATEGQNRAELTETWGG